MKRLLIVLLLAGCKEKEAPIPPQPPPVFAQQSLMSDVSLSSDALLMRVEEVMKDAAVMMHPPGPLVQSLDSLKRSYKAARWDLELSRGAVTAGKGTPELEATAANSQASLATALANFQTVKSGFTAAKEK